MPDGGLPDEIKFLNELADGLCRSVVGGAANSLIFVKASPQGCEANTLPLHGLHPANVLLGADAPPDWIALGVATHGRPFPLDGDHRRKLPASGAVVVLVHRDGTLVGRLRVGDIAHDEPPAYGLILDSLQRAFGLPTADPQASTGVRFTSLWLENVLGAARHSLAPLNWPDAVALHPAALILADDDSVSVDEHNLVPAALALERRCDWERLRWLVVEGGWHEPAITPTDAAWLDAGSFSRLVLTGAMPVRQALAEVRRMVSPAIARRCRTVVHQLGIRSDGVERPSRGSAA